MKLLTKPTIITILLVTLIFSCKHDTPRVITGGPEVVSFRALPFEIKDVQLLDGPFKHATELNIQSLLNYQPDRLLSKFRTEAGLKPKAEAYSGWEAMTIAGHSLGHYLSACALMYQTTGDQRFLERVNYIVAELDTCQMADNTGYIGAFSNGKKILEDEVAKGNIRAQGFDLNGIWVPYYTQHKVMAGLIDAYDLCGNQKALEINRKFADWLYTIISPLNEEQIQKCCTVNMAVLTNLWQNYMPKPAMKNTSECRVFSTTKQFSDRLLKELIFCQGNMPTPKFRNWLDWPGVTNSQPIVLIVKRLNSFGTAWFITIRMLPADIATTSILAHPTHFVTD
jgi:hypothetical protein